MVNRKTATKKSAPVPVSSPEMDCSLWCDLTASAKGIKTRLESLKKRMLALIPDNHQQERIAATRNGVPGFYVITRIEQDRRKIDNEALMTLMREKLTATQLAAACKLYPDHDAVAELVMQGVISANDFAACLIGSQPKYPTCVFEEAK